MQSKNKKLLFKKSIYYLVGFAPLIITLFIYTYIPEQVPSHYTTVGEIANWDHKGKVLIILNLGYLLKNLNHNQKKT